MSVTLRPADLPRDLARMAELLSAVHPEPVTTEQMQEWEMLMPTEKIRQLTTAVDETGRMLGFNASEHFSFHLPNSFHVDVVVDPQFRRQGTGSRLFDDAEGFALAHGATRLESEVRDHDPEWRAFAERRGFVQDRHVFESRLDLASFDESRFAGVVEAVEASGIRLTSLAETGMSDTAKRYLYELNKRNSLDIPGAEGTFPTFEDFSRFVFAGSWFRPEGQILALDGERFVGLSAVGYFPETNSTYTMHTGVDRAYRGRDIALALKLLGIRLSKHLGASYIRTNNDSQNAPILAINQKLGFRPLPGYYRLLKTFE